MLVGIGTFAEKYICGSMILTTVTSDSGNCLRAFVTFSDSLDPSMAAKIFMMCASFLDFMCLICYNKAKLEYLMLIL